MTNRASSPPATSSARTGGAILGIVVFLVGIALVGYVFYTARVLFDTPPPTIPTPPPAPLVDPNAATNAAATVASDPAAPSVANAVGQPLIKFVQQLLVLIVMCIAGSVVASRGIELFFKALAAASAAHLPAAPDAD